MTPAEIRMPRAGKPGFALRRFRDLARSTAVSAAVALAAVANGVAHAQPAPPTATPPHAAPPHGTPAHGAPPPPPTTTTVVAPVAPAGCACGPPVMPGGPR